MWNSFYRDNFRALRSGEFVDVPRCMPHPSRCGASHINVAEYAGQCDDWVFPIAKGGRLHIHEYPDGRMRAHLDKYDPDKGFGEMLKHFFLESNTGKFVGVLALIIGGAAICRR